jgi:proteasome lid subunit RPN8/RPN11
MCTSTPFTRLLIPQSLIEALIAHARAELPNECCGLLAGRVEGGTGTVSARFALRNDAASPTDYLSNPRDLLDAMRAVRRDGIDVLAVYHSHPSSAPIPSKNDLARNYWGDAVVHVIVGVAGGEPEIRAWWLGEREYREVAWHSA